MTLDLFRSLLEGLGPSVVSVALCSARLLPVAFLCPLLGGQATPTRVKLTLVLTLALFLHQTAGVSLSTPVETPVQLAALTVKELSYGTALGLVAALPFDAARMGGRFIDLFRGTSAEASLPVTGTRESASGDALHQLLVGMVVTGGLMPLVLSGLVRGFGWVRLGAYVPSEGAAFHVVGLVGGALATGFAVGAPVAAATMTVDCLWGMVSRAAPQVNLQEMGAPVRILAGGALLWLGVGVLCDRLLASFLSVEDALFHLAEVAR
ncbi:EscT/YscT/HrcT family type III secretion system export apparatus protein [Melittangium boletus]|uniref:Flagellar biosynthesis protein FliR n=1 Tax=Melittangium boletus DSM 14713 TaxID=1294270 RepID=A0A250IA67_9BACT|nr:flagellar biosynthetic protein FliR [Melittangium boletus]ATB27856.1 flagellar biosynthesis protein FliR [Melittangium boletus DSM 14713]